LQSGITMSFVFALFVGTVTDADVAFFVKKK
jgi:hypothetical protein